MRKFFKDSIAVLAIVLGLIGMVWSFHLAVEIQLLASLGIVICGLIYLLGQVLVSRGPEFQILYIEKVLQIKDAEAHRALFLRKSREVANTDNLKELWFRNIAATGKIEDIEIDGQPAQEGVNVFTELNLISLKKLFPRPVKKGERTETSVTYTLLDSFPKPSEKLIHVVNYKTEKLRLVVELPDSRPAKSATLVEVYGGTGVKDKSSFLKQQKPTYLEANLENIKPGANYILQWTW